jgi:hypothetical protein
VQQKANHKLRRGRFPSFGPANSLVGFPHFSVVVTIDYADAVQLHHMMHLSSTDVGTNPQIPQHRTLRLTISIEPPLVDTIANRSKTPECERNPRFRSRAAKAVGAAPWMAVSGLHMKGVNEEGFATGSGMRTDGFGDGQSSNRFRVLS